MKHVVLAFMLLFAAGNAVAAPAPPAAKPAAAPVARKPASPTPPAPGLPVFVQLLSIEGLPTDSLVRGQFLAGFRGEFAEEQIPAERRSSSGEWEHGAPLFNRFKWLEGDQSDDTWTLHVVVGSPPAVVLPQKGSDRGHRVLETRRRSRGMIAAFDVQAPNPGGGAPPAVHERFAFAFRAAEYDSTGSLSVPGVGYVFPWTDAGRTVARLALEVLHREHGELDPDRRLAIDPALRTDAGR